MSADVVLVIVVATALVFDFTNGFHDTANVVATSISTRAMPPRLAVAYAALRDAMTELSTTGAIGSAANLSTFAEIFRLLGVPEALELAAKYDA